MPKEAIFRKFVQDFVAGGAKPAPMTLSSAGRSRAPKKTSDEVPSCQMRRSKRGRPDNAPGCLHGLRTAGPDVPPPTDRLI
ncbi:hypothetical protein [Tistrella mobilis]|uniref:hypothetical protein n=1 Tax=Tistrella mobilis TaxID=171437 RepID=UPI00355603A6